MRPRAELSEQEVSSQGAMRFQQAAAGRAAGSALRTPSLGVLGSPALPPLPITSLAGRPQGGAGP